MNQLDFNESSQPDGTSKRQFRAFMKTGSPFTQALPSLLTSAVIGILLALIIGLSALNILDYGLHTQLFILALLSVGLCIFSYVLLTRCFAHFKSQLTLKDSSLGVIIRKVFLAVFFLFPLCLILYQQIVEFLHILWTGQSSDFIGWLPPNTDSRVFFIQVFPLSYIFLLAIVLAGRRLSVQKFFSDLPDFWYVLFILGLSLAIRFPIIYSINTQPISDFGVINEDALALAQGGRPAHMYVATHVAVTMIYGFVYQMFGSDLNVLKIFHAVVYGLAGMLLYGAGKLFFKSKLWAGMTALLLVGWPSLAVYSNVLTPEHLFILVECALVFAVAYFFKHQETVEGRTADNPTRQSAVWSVVIGLLIGLMGMFRPFSELFLVAFVLTLFLYTKNLKGIAVNLVCVLIAFWLPRNLPTMIAAHYQNQFASIRPCNLLVGMNFETAGQYNTGDVTLCSKLHSEISDGTMFTQTVLGIVWERFQEQQHDLIPFLGKKFAILWANSNGILFWSVGQVKGGDPNSIFATVQKINLTDFAIMFLINITCAIGTGLAFFRNSRPVLFFCLLAFFGFNLMEIPFEMQTRYRTVVMPMLIFFACWTLDAISLSISSHNWVAKGNSATDELNSSNFFLEK